MLCVWLLSNRILTCLISRVSISLSRIDRCLVNDGSSGHRRAKLTFAAALRGHGNGDKRARLERFHRPYHAALGELIAAAQPRLILSLHSFTPQLATSAEKRPWEVALLYNQDDRAARHAIRLFREQGLTVGDNEPYSGTQLNATMDRHAEAQGIPYCLVEIRQDQVANEAGQARWAMMLADVMGRVALEV